MNRLPTALAGILLLELLIYIATIILLSNLLFSLYLQSHTMVTKSERKGLHYLQLYVGLDAIKYELQKAPGTLSRWHVHTNQLLIWKGYEGNDHAIRQDGHKLIKITGIYDWVTQRWHHKHKTLLLDHIKRWDITYEYLADYIVMIVGTIVTDKDEAWHIKVALPNGRYLVQ